MMITAKDLKNLSSLDKALTDISYVIVRNPREPMWRFLYGDKYPLNQVRVALHNAGYETSVDGGVLVIEVAKRVIDIDSQINFSCKLEVLGDDDEEKFWRGLEDVITKYVDEHGGVSDFEMVAL